MPALAHKCWHTHLQCLHARTYAHARAHTHTHTCMHAHAHMHAHTHAHARVHTHTPHIRTQTRTHARAHAHKHTQLSLGPTLWPGDMLFYRLACVHMCVWHRTTGIALYFGPKYRQSPTEPNFRINFLPGRLCTVPCMPSKSDAEIPSARGSSGRYSG